MDVTASVLTIAQTVFVIAMRLKNLANDSRAHELEIEKLQDRARRHLRMIQASLNIVSGQVRPIDDLPPNLDKTYVKKRLPEVALDFETEFEGFKKDLIALEGRSQTVNFVIWGRSGLTPIIDKIKATIGQHEHELGLLLHIHHGIAFNEKFEELSRVVSSMRRPSEAPSEVPQFDPPNPTLQPTATFDSQSSGATLVGRTSRQASLSTQHDGEAHVTNGSLSPREEETEAELEAEMSPLHCAISDGNMEEIKQSLDDGADGESQHKQETPTLHLALQKSNHEAIIDLLLERHDLGDITLDLNAENNEMKTALHKCAEMNKGAIARELLRRRARTDIRDAGDKTALYYAIKRKYYYVVEVLLEGGAELSEEYFKIDTSAEIKKLLKQKNKETCDDGAKKEGKRKNSRTFSIGSLSPLRRRGSKVTG